MYLKIKNKLQRNSLAKKKKGNYLIFGSQILYNALWNLVFKIKSGTFMEERMNDRLQNHLLGF